MRIAIFGAGGVGGYFGARLADAGEEVIFIARGAHLEAFRKSGLRVDSLLGDVILKPVQATDEPGEVGTVDVVIVAVKAWQVPEAAVAMLPMIGPNTFVVPLCNGVEAVDQLIDVIGADHVLGGLCRISSYISEPGHIIHVAGVTAQVVFGELDGSQSERCSRLRQAFERAGVNVEIPVDILGAMWEKFIFIAAISGVGSVTRVPVGIIRELPETRQMLLAVLDEIRTVSIARGIHLPDNIIETTLAFIDRISPEVIPSMQRDVMAGRPSELDSQIGAVVRMGEETGVSTPVNEFIYRCLLPQELLARGKL